MNSTIRRTINRAEQAEEIRPSKYFPAEPPGAAGKGNTVGTEPTEGQLTPVGCQALAIETAAPMAEEMPLVLAVEPQARHGHNIPYVSSRQGNFLRSRKKRKK